MAQRVGFFRRFWFVTALAAALFFGSPAPPSLGQSADPLQLQADHCFAGMAPHAGVYPMVVEIKNAGPSVDGALVVASDNYAGGSSRRYVYPVSLPTGTVKRVLVYPAVESYTSSISVALEGPFRTRKITLPFAARSAEGRQVGLVGDYGGGLASLRTPGDTASSSNTARRRARSASANSFNDCYAKPEWAPERAAGYQGLSALIVADGAERMSAVQWKAIRHWVMSGGSLVLTGGASGVYLRGGEAARLCPLENLRGAVIAGSQLGIQGPLLAGSVALTTGTLKPGARALLVENGFVVKASRSLGAGTILFVGFNPLEKPFRGRNEGGALWAGLLRDAAPAASAGALRAVAAGQQSSFDSYRGGGGGAVQADVDPFRIKLPLAGTIATVFVAYFVLVVPTTFLVLRRLGRLEWAWVTSPVLAAVFAYAFYLFTADLYLAGLSRRTGGIVVAGANEPEARFWGFSELFFPRGGSYQIVVPGAETLEMTTANEYGYTSSGGTVQALETVDDGGTVVAPDFGVANLAFRRVYHAQPVSFWNNGVTTTLQRNAATGDYAGTVRNGTGETLRGAVVLLPVRRGGYLVETRRPRTGQIAGNLRVALLGDLKPGQTKPLGKIQPLNSAPGAYQKAPVLGTLLRENRTILPQGALLLAQTDGAPFGPPLGKSVGGDKSVVVLVSVPVGGSSR